MTETKILFTSKATEERKAHRVIQYYAQLGALEKTKEDPIRQLLEHAQDKKHIVALFKDESPRQLNYMFARILQHMSCPKYAHFNIYDFVKMQWGNHPTYDSYQYVKAPVILIWGGYNELANKSLESMGVDFLVRRTALAHGTTFMLLKKGKYPILESEASTVADAVIDLAITAVAGGKRRNV